VTVRGNMAVFMKLPAVVEATMRSKASIYRDMPKGRFPRQVILGDRSVAWLTAEIRDWIANRPRSSGAPMDNVRIKSSIIPAVITRPSHGMFVVNHPDQERLKGMFEKYHLELASFLNNNRIEASLINAKALRHTFSKSFTSGRQRLSKARVRSTIQHQGRTLKPLTLWDRVTISTKRRGNGNR
jgi:prophage regulatory protein